MHSFETIYRWVKKLRRQRLESAPFEELFRRYQKEAAEKKGLFDEFCRRLSRLVYRAAQEYIIRHGGHNPELESHRVGLEAEAANLKDRIFRSFVPQMAVGDPAFGLCRFATCIRSELDDEAFKCIARAFYYQLPLYHVSDDEQRRFLAAMFQEQDLSLRGVSYRQQLAQRFQVSEEHAAGVVKQGWQRLNKIIAEDFDERELCTLTEGYVHAVSSTTKGNDKSD